MKVKLQLKTAGKGKRSFTLRHAEAVIGRSHGNKVRIPSNDVSRKHCRICIQDETVTVEDLNSVNGTFLNSQRVEGIREMHPGDLLQVGPVTFLVRFVQDEPVILEDVDVELLGPDDEDFEVELPTEDEPGTAQEKKHPKGASADKKPPRKKAPETATIPVLEPGQDEAEDKKPAQVEFDQAWVPPEAEAFRDILQGLEDGENPEGEEK